MKDVFARRLVVEKDILPAGDKLNFLVNLGDRRFTIQCVVDAALLIGEPFLVTECVSQQDDIQSGAFLFEVCNRGDVLTFHSSFEKDDEVFVPNPWHT